MEDKKQKLEEIAQEVATCQRCSLYKNATNPVPGEGNPEAEVMFIGEGPGYWEDQKGIPFCGAAGKLLDELLASIGIKRRDVFIGNVVKHRSPENREPLPEEIEACQEFLDRQIEIIQPKVIVTLGRFSLNKFLPEGRITQIHGRARMVEFQGQRITLVPMFHPAAALRRGEVMELLKQDFLKLSNYLKNEEDSKIQAIDNEEIIKNEGKKGEDLQLPLI
jgi:DNA polymerase